MSIGTLPNVNFMKMNRDVKQGTSVCSHTARLKNNQAKSPKKSFNPQRKERRQGCCRCCESCATVGLCLARLRAIRTSEKREVSGKHEAELDLNSAELETMRISKSPTTVTANGEVRTGEEATVHAKEVDLFVTAMLLGETPAVLSLGKLCEDHVAYLPLDQWSKTTSHQKWQEHPMQHSELRTIRCPWPVDEFLYFRLHMLLRDLHRKIL